jgi:hypothetical protein
LNQIGGVERRPGERPHTATPFAMIASESAKVRDMARPDLAWEDVSTMTQPWEEPFAEKNHEIRERMATSSFAEIRDAYRDLERTTIAAVMDDPARLAVRRRAAEWLLYAAIKMRRPFEECESLLEEVARLGFASPQERVITVAVFARHCLLSGRKDDGYRHFLPAMTELEKAPGVIAGAPPELVEGYRRLLAQLSPSGGNNDQP